MCNCFLSQVPCHLYHNQQSREWSWMTVKIKFKVQTCTVLDLCDSMLYVVCVCMCNMSKNLLTQTSITFKSSNLCSGYFMTQITSVCQNVAVSWKGKITCTINLHYLNLWKLKQCLYEQTTNCRHVFSSFGRCYAVCNDIKELLVGMVHTHNLCDNYVSTDSPQIYYKSTTRDD